MTNSHNTGSHIEKVNSLRFLLWLLLIVFTFNFIDRSIINILAEPISRELGLSDTQLGLLTGLAFALFYAVLGVPIARYADKPHSNRVGIIAVSLALWSAMTAVSGLTQNFAQLLLARIGVGVGEAGCTPAAHSLISDLVPREKRASAIGFYGLGVPIGGMLGLVIGGQINDAFGWRWAFVMVGLPGMFLAVLIWFSLRDPRAAALAREMRAASAVSQISLGVALREILGNRSFVLLAFAAGLTAFLSYGKGVWVAIFYMRSFGLSVGEVGLWLGLTNGIGGAIGIYIGGWVADRYGKHNPRHLLTAPAIGMAVATPLMLIGYYASSWQVAMIWLFVPVVMNMLYWGPTYSVAQRLVRPHARALASSIMIFAQNLIGLGLGPLLFGMMSDYLKPIAGPESVRWVLLGAGLCGVLPALLYWRTSLTLKTAIDPD